MRSCVSRPSSRSSKLTLRRSSVRQCRDSRLVLRETEKIPEVPSSDINQGVLPRIIAGLVQRRRQVKALMKDKTATPSQLLQWNIKQSAFKLTACQSNRGQCGQKTRLLNEGGEAVQTRLLTGC